MKNFRIPLLIIMVFVLPSATSLAADTDSPKVGEPYQISIDEAWEEAKVGEIPTHSCAAVKGRTMGAKGPEAAEPALRALFACNVDIPVRYFETYLDRVEAGDHTCMDFMRHFVTQISAMTMSMDSMQQLLDSAATAGETEPMSAAEAREATNALLASIAKDAVTDKGPEDPQRLVKSRLSERTHELCPDIAGVVLR